MFAGSLSRWRAVAIFSTCVFALSACQAPAAAANAARNRNEVAGNAGRPAAIAEARNTYLLRSGRVFFPDDQPLRPDFLPDLSDTQIELIATILESELQNIRDAQRRHVTMLAGAFPGHDIDRVRLDLVPTATGAALAGSLPDTGRITIDAKVVQAIYRAALIAIFASESEVGADMPMEGRQAFAFRAFAAYRLQLASLPEFRSLGDLRAFRRGASAPDRDADLDRRLAGGMELLNDRLMEAGTIIMSKQLERAFLGAIRFMLAHEAGHVALAHPVTPVSCEQAVENERTADRYAVLASALAAYRRMPGLVLRHGATFAQEVILSPLEDMVFERSDGAVPFFSYAYGLAGFDSRFETLPGCRYPEPRERLAALAQLAAVINSVHYVAVRHQSLRRFGSRETRRNLGTTPFEDMFPNLPRLAETDGPFPADLESLRPVLREVFYDTYRRDD